MALATYSGTLRNFAGQNLLNPRLWVHPAEPSIRPGSGRVLSDKPIEVTVASNGDFTVQLEEGHRYRLEALSPDEARGRVARSSWSRSFLAVTGGGDIGDLIGLPERNGMIRVRQTNPLSSDYAQYVYNEATGHLFERTS